MTKSITEDVVDSIGVPQTVNTFYTNTAVNYDVAIGGLPFFLAASDKYPYQRETAAYRKQQVDLTQQPGEQTFEGWWLRSQSSWHLGAGIKYLEPLQGDNMIYRFDKSKGVDVWTPGKISLLSNTEKIMDVSSNIDMMGVIDGSNISCLFLSDDTVLHRVNSTGYHTTVSWGGSTYNIKSITQDGSNYYAANQVGIYKGTLAGGSGTKIWDTGNANVKIAWVKQRLFAGIGPSLYELVGSGPTLPTATYTHPNSNWVWTSIVEGPNAIYASGYAGTSSAIYKVTLNDNGTITSLTRAVTAADFPDEEHVTSLGVYLGKYMMIGTNKGVRVGIIDANGFISYGGLTVEQPQNSHVTGFAFQDRFAYATTTNTIDNMSGLIRIDLSQEVENGRYAWATDLCAEVGGACYNVAFVGETGMLAFTVEDEGLYFQKMSEVVPQGYLRTGAIRYNTLEKKHFKFVKVRVGEPFMGNVALSRVDKSGNATSIITIGSAAVADNDITTSLSSPQEQMALQFDLYRHADEWDKGGSVVGYQVKALPAYRKNRSVTIPIVCFDYESDRNNVQVGYEGSAWNRLADLEALESEGDTVVYQDFTSGELAQGVIEKVSFMRTSPPERRFNGFGGVVYVTLRTI